MQYIPALSLLGTLIILSLAVIVKLNNNQLVEFAKHSNALIAFSTVIFFAVGVIHLFSSQPWTPDLLKVVAGIIVGASAAAKTGSANERSFNARDIGNQNEIALGDINKIKQDIAQLNGNISSIQEAIINQTSSLADLSGDGKDRVVEYLFTTSFFSEGEPLGNIAGSAQRLSLDGWRFVALSDNYGRDHGDVGLLALFTRSRVPNADDERLPNGAYRPRFYHGLDQSELVA
jgi:hypothetical protein